MNSCTLDNVQSPRTTAVSVLLCKGILGRRFMLEGVSCYVFYWSLAGRWSSADHDSLQELFWTEPQP